MDWCVIKQDIRLHGTGTAYLYNFRTPY